MDIKRPPPEEQVCQHGKCVCMCACMCVREYVRVGGIVISPSTSFVVLSIIIPAARWGGGCCPDLAAQQRHERIITQCLHILQSSTQSSGKYGRV